MRRGFDDPYPLTREPASEETEPTELRSHHRLLYYRRERRPERAAGQRRRPAAEPRRRGAPHRAPHAAPCSPGKESQRARRRRHCCPSCHRKCCHDHHGECWVVGRATSQSVVDLVMTDDLVMTPSPHLGSRMHHATAARRPRRQQAPAAVAREPLQTRRFAPHHSDYGLPKRQRRQDPPMWRAERRADRAGRRRGASPTRLARRKRVPVRARHHRKMVPVRARRRP